MKIAILGSTLYVSPAEVGKIHAPLELTYALAKGLAQKGHEVTFFGLVNMEEKSQKYPNLTINESYCERPDKADEKGKFLKIIYEQTFFKKVIMDEEKNFDLFYTHIYLVGPLAGLTQKPIIFSHHDSTRIEEYQLMFDYFKAPNLLIVPVSDYLANLFKNRDYFLKYVHNSTETVTNIQETGDYFFWAGRIAPTKGLHIAIDLAKELNFNLKFVGQPGNFGGLGDQKNYWEQIQETITQTKNIEYLGFTSQNETKALMARAKAFIFPTDGTESFAMVVAEAMMAGVPVIAFNKGPMKELIKNGVSGFLCENLQEMKNAILNIESIDREQCANWAKENFSLEKMTEGYEKHFQELL